MNFKNKISFHFYDFVNSSDLLSESEEDIVTSEDVVADVDEGDVKIEKETDSAVEDTNIPQVDGHADSSDDDVSDDGLNDDDDDSSGSDLNTDEEDALDDVGIEMDPPCSADDVSDEEVISIINN